MDLASYILYVGDNNKIKRGHGIEVRWRKGRGKMIQSYFNKNKD